MYVEIWLLCTPSPTWSLYGQEPFVISHFLSHGIILQHSLLSSVQFMSIKSRKTKIMNSTTTTKNRNHNYTRHISQILLIITYHCYTKNWIALLSGLIPNKEISQHKTLKKRWNFQLIRNQISNCLIKLLVNKIGDGLVSRTFNIYLQNLQDFRNDHKNDIGTRK